MAERDAALAASNKAQTAQNAAEARYVLACIMFLRLVTKSFRGDDPMAGSPPPVLRLSGHGTNLLPQVPVVVQDFALTLPNNVDYITINDNKHTDGSRRAFHLKSMDFYLISKEFLPNCMDCLSNFNRFLCKIQYTSF